MYTTGWQLRISCWTSIPLLSTIRRGGSKEGVLLSGVFLLDCSLENSVIAERSFYLSIYYYYTFPHKYNLLTFKSGPGSVVGIATAYGLDGPGIESRWGEIFRTSPDRP